MALKEAQRCLNCKNKPCQKGCPLGIDIPEFISKIKEKDFFGSFNVISKKSVFPLICSRVCPVENQCEGCCVRRIKGWPVKISDLEYYVSSICSKKIGVYNKNSFQKKIAVIGAGPAGLSGSIYLKKLGYSVSIYEKMPNIGGMLYYGIPESRLNKSLFQKELERFDSLNINVETNITVGKDLTLKDILTREKFDAVFLATGAWNANKLNIEGENLKNVFSFTEFLLTIKSKNNYFENRKIKNVAVIGGGNVAVDIARIAKNLKNIKKVYLLYRRSLDEMLANRNEIRLALKEEVEFKLLTSVKKIIGNEQNEVKEILCVKNKMLNLLDSSKRKVFSEIESSFFKMNTDAVIICAGAKTSDFFGKDPYAKFIYNVHGKLSVNEFGQNLKIPMIFAGGDSVLGPSTVAEACFDGQRIAKNIHEYLIRKENFSLFSP